ncbi:hypothetical protein EMWEY_00043730 [Eimeria maxima]|uniref:Uncharacterized protein n=1 Tax=Eimeria maxima TaxID=5804 RepID=U6MBT9_EIMMA|nr:hypothetical protein EMWEY_00043730 [Eimeria maxima]CDJ61677.1 hypothetical protein EMWEY_00043730 [Eimeria maxima]
MLVLALRCERSSAARQTHTDISCDCSVFVQTFWMEAVSAKASLSHPVRADKAVFDILSACIPSEHELFTGHMGTMFATLPCRPMYNMGLECLLSAGRSLPPTMTHFTVECTVLGSAPHCALQIMDVQRLNTASGFVVMDAPSPTHTLAWHYTGKSGGHVGTWLSHTSSVSRSRDGTHTDCKEKDAFAPAHHLGFHAIPSPAMLNVTLFKLTGIAFRVLEQMHREDQLRIAAGRLHRFA